MEKAPLVKLRTFKEIRRMSANPGSLIFLSRCYRGQADTSRAYTFLKRKRKQKASLPGEAQSHIQKAHAYKKQKSTA